MNAESLGQGWFDVRPVTNQVTAIVEPNHVECVISYLIEGRDRAILLDTGMGVGNIAELVARLTPKPVSVVNSHAHWDHIGDNWRFDEIAIHAAEADRLPEGVSSRVLSRWFTPDQLRGPLPATYDPATAEIPASHATRLLQDGDEIDLGDRCLQVLHLPGHSPGGIALYDGSHRWLFTTDVAYPSVLYAYGEDADLDLYRASLRRLSTLVPDLAGVSGSHDGTLLPPTALIDMADALDAIAAGRPADAQLAGRDHHLFNGFSVYAPPTLAGEREDE